MAGGKADHQAAPAASLQGIKAAGTPIGNVPYVPDATRSVYTALLQQHTQASHPQCRVRGLQQALLPVGFGQPCKSPESKQPGALQALATALARTQGGRKALSSLTKGLGLGPLVQVGPRDPRAQVCGC